MSIFLQKGVRALDEMKRTEVLVLYDFDIKPHPARYFEDFN